MDKLELNWYDINISEKIHRDSPMIFEIDLCMLWHQHIHNVHKLNCAVWIKMHFVHVSRALRHEWTDLMHFSFSTSTHTKPISSLSANRVRNIFTKYISIWMWGKTIASQLKVHCSKFEMFSSSSPPHGSPHPPRSQSATNQNIERPFGPHRQKRTSPVSRRQWGRVTCVYTVALSTTRVPVSSRLYAVPYRKQAPADGQSGQRKALQTKHVAL